jgi:cold shock CspA family protein
MPEGTITGIRGGAGIIDDGTEISKLFRYEDVVGVNFSELEKGMRVTFVLGQDGRSAKQVRVVQQDSTELERKYDKRRFI